MISNEFGDRGIDRNYDGKLQPEEIDIRARGTMGGFGVPHTPQQESPSGNTAMPGVQNIMYGGCFDVSESTLQSAQNLGIDVINIVPGVNVPTNIPTPEFISGVTDEFTCLYGSKSGNTWSYDNATSQPQCKNNVGVTLPRQTLIGGANIIPAPNVGDEISQNKNYKINCEYTQANDGRVWRPDYLRPGEFDEKSLSTILDEVNNGRVGDIDIFQDIKVTQGDVVMNHDNKETAVKGIVEESALSNYFFSDENTKAIQDTICYKVYQKTNEYIDHQSPQELYIVMRSILLQHANFKVSSKGLLDELRRLNKHVVDYCENEVSSNVLQYKGYLNDLRQLPIPLDRPSFNESGSRNRTYDLSNHIAPTFSSGWGSRHSSS